MPDPNVRQTTTARGPISSPVRDLKVMRRNVAATAGEVREFMARLRGKSPREMLGVVASSSLIKSVITATFATAILIAALTVIPYTWSKLFGPEIVAVQAESDDSSDPAGPPPPEEPATTTADPPADASSPTPESVDILGVGEEKPAPPGINPLEGAVDDLFDDVK